MTAITTEIQIDAPATDVWAALMDFDAYAEWNPFIIEIEGEQALGGRLRGVIKPEGARATTFRPTVTAFEQGRTFEWLGHLGVKGIFDGRHRFELHENGSGTRLVQLESFSGLLSGVIMRMIGSGTEAGFEAMNAALKERVESQGS